MRARVLLFLFLCVVMAGALVVLPGDPSASETSSPGTWNVSRATWYGPGFYGHGTACGQELTRDTFGVAHRRLPCGTMVELEWQGHHLTVPVIDRGPFGSSAEWDLTERTCSELTGRSGVNRCMTGDIAWRV